MERGQSDEKKSGLQRVGVWSGSGLGYFCQVDGIARAPVWGANPFVIIIAKVATIISRAQTVSPINRLQTGYEELTVNR